MSLKVIFMGTPEFSVPSLELLSKENNIHLICVYTQPSRKKNRGQKILASPVEEAAKKLKILIRKPNNLSSVEEFEYFKKLNPDLVVVVAYGKIIPEKYLKFSKALFINLHASLLPKWRGAAPIQRAIINGDKETGISIMKIESGLDVGPYISQEKILIDENSTTKTLSEKLSNIGAQAIIECLKNIIKKDVKFINQEHSKATYAKKISKEESKIIWGESSKKIVAKINAMNPSPVAWFKKENNRYKVWRAKISKEKGNIGEILDNNLTIGCLNGSIRITEIQKEGKKRMITKQFLAGNKFLKGDILN